MVELISIILNIFTMIVVDHGVNVSVNVNILIPLLILNSQILNHL